jgi:ankyrin repeat protein
MWRDPSVLQRHLNSGYTIDTADSQGVTLLFRACTPTVEPLTKGSDTLVTQVLMAGAGSDTKSKDGVTPLMVASSPDVANCLLDHGADIAREADDGSFALELACANGNLAVVKVLLQRGAVEQILKASKNGCTPLSAAAYNKHEDITLLLLQHLILQPSFDINHSRLARNQPLLCCAAVRGLCRVVEFALDHGADPNITGPNGSPLILAVQNRDLSIVSLLCQRGASTKSRFKGNTSLDEAVLKGDAKSVRALIKHGADVNAISDSKHASALVHAAVLGHCDIVRLLFDAGAILDTELQNELVTQCCSSLDDAAAVKVVQLLLPHCSSFADNNYQVGDKMLVVGLQEAVCLGKLQLAQLLQAAGANVH